MNYRHVFHAGSFADVMKHAVLALLIERLKEKEAGFRVIDTHAGIGLYDLSSDAALRTGEWEGGIARITNRPLEPAIAALLAPYLNAVTAANEGLDQKRYPGSPAIARYLLRRQDRLTLVELHPEDAGQLEQLFAGDHQVRVVELDGWLALGSFVPPKERRGIVLIDPPFEERNEFERMVDGLQKAHRRWPTGIYVLWYPVKDQDAIEEFCKSLENTGIRRLLRCELHIRHHVNNGRLNGSGLIICNPPWKFAQTVQTLLSGLSPLLTDGPGAGSLVENISGE